MVKFETSCKKRANCRKSKGQSQLERERKVDGIIFFNGGKLHLLTNNKLLKSVVVFIPSLSDTVTT